MGPRVQAEDAREGRQGIGEPVARMTLPMLVAWVARARSLRASGAHAYVVVAALLHSRGRGVNHTAMICIILYIRYHEVKVAAGIDSSKARKGI